MNKEDIIKFFKQQAKPISFEELKNKFNLSNKKELSKLRRYLKNLIKKGIIYQTKNRNYCLTEEAEFIKGRIEFNPAGFAFLIPDPEFKNHADIFLKPKTLIEALHDDKALVRIDGYKKNGKPVGTVLKILERGFKEITGIFYKNKGFAFVVPIDKRIVRDFYIPEKNFNGAKNGDVVLIKILDYPTKTLNPVGEVKKVLGKPGKEKTLISTINIKYGIKEKFPPSVLVAAKKIENQKIKILKNRIDLRDKKIFTIDGIKARDFDDAVGIEIIDNKFKLYVSIADVEYFVKEKKVIDREAYERSTSVYYPDRVYPMLPEALSNNLCSLNPGVDRLTFTIELLIDKDGNILEKKAYKSIINSKIRGVYEEINDFLKNNKNSKFYDKYKIVENDLLKMIELTNILRERRFQKGSIDFNLPEVEIEVDKKGKVINIKKVKRELSHILIEEFMLAANEAVAELLTEKNIPLLYRIHEPPDEEKLYNIEKVLASLGIYKEIRSVHDIQKILKIVEGQPFEKLVNYLILRSMKQAKYSPENIGHFALAKFNYTHFTSPIRRYPDLVNHRILRKMLLGKIKKNDIDNLFKYLIEVGKHTSEKERKADEAEREVVNLKKIEFMENKVGSEFKGTITGVNSHGFFVEIDDYLVEGFVPLRNLTDDYYKFFEEEFLLRGKRRSNQYRLGDSVLVKILNVDKIEQSIEMDVLKKID